MLEMAQKRQIYMVSDYLEKLVFILSSSFASLHNSFLHRKRLRRASEFPMCIPRDHTAEQLQQLLLQVNSGGRRISFLYFKKTLRKILFCELLHPAVSQVCLDSSCKTTLGMREWSLIHWTGSSISDVFSFSGENHCLPVLILSCKNGASSGWNKIANCCLMAQPTGAGRGLWKANTFLCVILEKVSKKALTSSSVISFLKDIAFSAKGLWWWTWSKQTRKGKIYVEIYTKLTTGLKQTSKQTENPHHLLTYRMTPQKIWQNKNL